MAYNRKENQEAALHILTFYSVFLLALSLLAIVSGIYLGLSIYRIKKLITAKKVQVNTKIMILHAATFSLYMLITIVAVLFLGLA